MCMLAMDGLNDVMPPKIITDVAEAEIKRANSAVKNILNSDRQAGYIEAINNMPQPKILKFMESVQYFAGAKTSRLILEVSLDRFIAVLRQHKEMVSLRCSILR